MTTDRQKPTDEGALPPGLLACREYPVTLRSGRAITLGFSLGDSDHKTLVRMKRACDALHLGLLVVMGDPETQEEAIVWIHQAAALTLISQSDADISIGTEVGELLPRWFAVFFGEIKDLAPGLEEIILVPSRTGQESVN